MLAPNETIAESDPAPEFERDLIDLVMDFVPRASRVKTKHDAHRPKDLVAREFYRGVSGHFQKQGYPPPTATDLADLSIFCGIEKGPRTYRRWEDRLTTYRREEKARSTPGKS